MDVVYPWTLHSYMEPLPSPSPFACQPLDDLAPIPRTDESQGSPGNFMQRFYDETLLIPIVCHTQSTHIGFASSLQHMAASVMQTFQGVWLYFFPPTSCCYALWALWDISLVFP